MANTAGLNPAACNGLTGSSPVSRTTYTVSYELKFPDWEQRVKNAAKVAESATQAAKLLNIKFDTYKKYAIKYGCYVPNQAGIGISKDRSHLAIPTEDIVIHGLHPQYQSNKLRKRLLDEGWFDPVCSSCNLTTWLNKPIPLELDHIDGNTANNLISNLRLLCPNCHAFTPTYRGKNINNVSSKKS